MNRQGTNRRSSDAGGVLGRKKRRVEFIRARVSDEAYSGWRRFADEQGVSLAALIEATGLTLHEELVGDENTLTERNRRLLQRARAVDAQRRKR